MDNVKSRYGKVDQVTFARMEEVLATPLDHVKNLEKHVATQKRHMLMQTSAGYPLEEYRKVPNFRKSVAMHPQIQECLGDYDKKVEDPLLHTYDAIVGYVATHLPSISAAAGLSSSAMTGKAFQVSGTQGVSTAATPLQMTMAELQCAYSVLECEHKALQTSRQKRQGNGKEKRGKKARSDGKETQESFTKEDCKYHCHSHGYQNSHNSSQCKVMANQPNNFSSEQRRAMDPLRRGKSNPSRPLGSWLPTSTLTLSPSTGQSNPGPSPIACPPPTLLHPWSPGWHGCWRTTTAQPTKPTRNGVGLPTPSSGPWCPLARPLRPLRHGPRFSTKSMSRVNGSHHQ
jgi:hypothetical protein